MFRGIMKWVSWDSKSAWTGKREDDFDIWPWRQPIWRSPHTGTPSPWWLLKERHSGIKYPDIIFLPPVILWHVVNAFTILYSLKEAPFLSPLLHWLTVLIISMLVDKNELIQQLHKVRSIILLSFVLWLSYIFTATWELKK